MNISVCTTVLNEEGSIGKLLDSLLNQTKKADEIVIVDGGSTDRTIEIINHYQKRFRNIKLLKEKCTRGKGRNLSVEMSKNEIIAMTDAGCVADPDWLERITKLFENDSVDVVAGYYKITGFHPASQAMGVFMGVPPSKFDNDFLPSTRSIAFRKSIWEKVGGFPENLETAEDTVFNYKLIKSKARISRVKEAVVEWGMPTTITNFHLAIFNYAKGDARSKIWLFPEKGITSHNIKAVFIILRYVLGSIFLILSFKYRVFALYLCILISLYLFRSYRKAGLWGIVLQFVSDFAVMVGFISGIIG